jgi:DnaJ-class molecular chaperone
MGNPERGPERGPERKDTQHACAKCYGKGQVNGARCPDCQGTGYIKKS